MFWDDGSKANDLDNAFLAEMNYIQGRLEMLVFQDSPYISGMYLDTILIYGVTPEPSEITVSGGYTGPLSYSYDSDIQVLNITLHKPINEGLLLNVIN